MHAADFEGKNSNSTLQPPPTETVLQRSCTAAGQNESPPKTDLREGLIVQRPTFSIAMRKSVESERLLARAARIQMLNQPVPSFVGSLGVLLYMRLYDVAGSSALESCRAQDIET